VHLVVVLIGAAYLARARTRAGLRRAAGDVQAARSAPAPAGNAATSRRAPSATNVSPKSPHP
jgi:hypothetical protein